jgi:hypothetical protein
MKWNQEQLISAVAQSTSIRQVLGKLGLVEAGGNYTHICLSIKKLQLDTSHFTGRGWRRGLQFTRKPILSLEQVLTKNSTYQSFKLKKRLLNNSIFKQKCSMCGWAEKSEDGRIPLELDHINGEHTDNRIENLRILCPNCHSLQSTHRGRNKKKS